MKKILVVAGVTFTVNLLVGLLLSFYPWQNMLFTSLAILVNTLLMALLFALGAESTHRLSVGMIFGVIGLFEYFSGLFAPIHFKDNWWLITFILLTAAQVILTFLTLHYTKKQ